MADNYLEKKMEEYRSGKPASVRAGKNLDTLAASLRSVSAFDPAYAVHPFQLQSIIRICNRMGVRLHEVCREDASLLLQCMNLEKTCGEDGLPNAFIIAGEASEFDLGMAAQALLLKTAELGLSSMIIRDFPAAEIKMALGLDLTPSLIIAVGRGK